MEKSTVYLLENDQGVTRSIEDICLQRKLSIISSSDSSELLRHINGDKATCLFASNALTDDGLSILHGARNKVPGLPVFILGDTWDVHSAVKAIKAGADDFIEKPAIRRRVIAQLNQLHRACGLN